MSKQTAKGTRWESAVRDYLNETHGFRVYRPRPDGFRDSGDLHGLSPFVGQCKDWRDVTGAVREGLDGAQRQKAHAGEEFGVAFVKRARKPVAEGYAVLRIEDFAEILARLRTAEAAR